MSEIERIPPHNVEAEQAVIGSIMIERAMFDVVAGLVDPRDFYAPRHESIFAAIRDLHADDKPIDKITVAEELRVRGMIEKIGGVPYLSQMMETVPTAASAGFYAKVVREKSLLRGLIHAGIAVSQLGYEAEDDVPAALQRAESLVHGISGRGTGFASAPRTTAEINERIFRRAAERFDGVGETAQLTPWPTLNTNTGGFCPGEFIMWAGDAKVGKSSVIIDLFDFIAAHYGPVLVFTNEMPEQDIMRRYNALYSGVSARRLRLGQLEDKDWEPLGRAMTITAERPVIFRGFEVESLADIRREANRVKAQTPDLAAIVIDHCGNISDVDRDDGRTNKNERLSRVYKALPRLANETETVVHGVQHINRSGAKGRPNKHDVRDGGNAEGHVNTMVLVYRPKPDGTLEERERGEFIIAACRDGIEGPMAMRYRGHRSLWTEDDGLGSVPWFERQDDAAPDELPFFEGVA